MKGEGCSDQERGLALSHFLLLIHIHFLLSISDYLLKLIKESKKVPLEKALFPISDTRRLGRAFAWDAAALRSAASQANE